MSSQRTIDAETGADHDPSSDNSPLLKSLLLERFALKQRATTSRAMAQRSIGALAEGLS